MHSVPAVYVYNMTDKVKNILKYRLDFCKIMLKSIVGSLRRMGRPRFPPYVEVRSTILRGGTMLIALGYTKSLSLGRGAELVEAERGFAAISLFTRHLIACFFIAQLTINTTYFICLQTAVPSQSPFGRQLSPRRASNNACCSR